MNTTHLTGSEKMIETCEICGEKGHVTTTKEKDHFEYGIGKDVVTISTEINVHHCSVCDSSFTGEDASEARHNAVCNFLNIYTPTEILNLREKYHFSQADFSDVTKLGKASIARWEGGVVLQNPSIDNFLYLLSFSENMTRLINKSKRVAGNGSNSNVIEFKPKFKSIPINEIAVIQQQATKFELYPTGQRA